MNETELKERIKKGENIHTEFKETLPDKNVILKEIVSFANTNGGHYYIRSSNRCRQASREELMRLFQAGESLYFDETAVYRADLNDLDMEYFKEYLRDVVEINANEAELRNYLKNLHLIDKHNKPTAAGILFFGKKPQFFFQGSKARKNSWTSI